MNRSITRRRWATTALATAAVLVAGGATAQATGTFLGSTPSTAEETVVLSTGMAETTSATGSSTLGPATVVYAPGTAPVPSTTTAPRPGGLPGATNTGVPAGITLKVHTGDLVITQDNTVIDGLDVRGFIEVRAKNVVIRNTKVRGTYTERYRALIRVENGFSATIEDSELAAANPSPWVDGIRGFNFTARRVNIHNVIDSVHIYGSNVTLENSWLHDNLHYANDPAWNGGPSHDDSIQITQGSNLRFLNNNISGSTSAGFMVTQGQGIVSNLEISGNRADGGACTVNFSEKGRGPIQGVKILTNTFGRNTTHADCAIIAPETTRAIITATGNTYTDGTAATIRRG